MSPAELPDGIRLQKVLSAAGLGSRRKCEELIADGRVSVDGVVVEEMGRRVDPLVAVIHVDGARVNVRQDLVYLALNKPLGVLSAMSDDRGRPTVGDLLTGQPESVFHVGRLDADTEGLLLLTNDGELGHRLMHPSFGVVKTYVAEVDGAVRKDLGRRLRAGVELEDGPVKVDGFRLIQTSGELSLVEVSLHEGRNRIVRRMLDEVGHPVRSLVRTAIGPVRLGGQRSGSIRTLSRTELAELHALVDKQIDL
ncbi:pseudouridine synthase [Jatrophihabitans sp. GAS493]|uniref:pseudouridine synthase n=1 Tax=Jatrophihabitans sp. GAS493 TaxID=1907575 RepID=UPI000BB8D097|nr:pseudouridine synthase [Jatrophihabitans sp. GAS493]SOD73806.1 pseudouridine synthase [Jatrophihabitans sp. GAS493]